MMNGLYKLLLVVLCGLSLSACSGTYPWFRSEALPPLQGRVIDEQTNAPIEGAIVVIRWETDGGWSNHFCPHVVTVTTDSAGRFVSPGWEEWSQHVRTIREPPVIYKPGYEAGMPSEREGILYVKRSKLSPQARLEYLYSLEQRARCAEGGKSNFNRYHFMRAVYGETKKMEIAETDVNKQRLRALKWSMAADYVSKNYPLPAKERLDQIEQFLRDEGNE